MPIGPCFYEHQLTVVLIPSRRALASSKRSGYARSGVFAQNQTWHCSVVTRICVRDGCSSPSQVSSQPSFWQRKEGASRDALQLIIKLLNALVEDNTEHNFSARRCGGGLQAAVETILARGLVHITSRCNTPPFVAPANWSTAATWVLFYRVRLCFSLRSRPTAPWCYWWLDL